MITRKGTSNENVSSSGGCKLKFFISVLSRSSEGFVERSMEVNTAGKPKMLLVLGQLIQQG